MTKSYIKSAVLAASMAASFVSAPASAATVISCFPSNSCSFGNANPTVGVGPFTDVYTFVLPYARTFVGRIYSEAVNFPVDNVNFATNGVTLDGTRFTVVQRPNPEEQTITKVLAAGTHTISVRGNSGADGFYTGSATLGGVPEPLTWAMLILGFGVVGASLRRRVRNANVSYA